MSPGRRSGPFDEVQTGYAELVGRALLGSELAAIAVMDAEWRVVEFNVAAEDLFGRERGEVIGTSFGELIISPLLHRSRVTEHGRRLTGEPSLLGTRTEQTAVRRDGSHFPIELSVVQERGEGGAVFVGFIRDISQRRLSEYRLAKSRALLAGAEELAGSGSFERELRSRAVAWSDGMYQVFGLTKGSTAPQMEDVFALIHPDDREPARQALAAIATERPDRFDKQVRVVRPDGSERMVEFRGRVVFDDFGEADRLVGTARDVTEEVEARRGLDLLAYVVESSEDAIITQAPDGIITSWNRGAEHLFGYSTEEVIGQPITLLAPEEEAERQVEMTERVFRGETVRHLETTRRRRDGSRVAVALSLSPVRDHDGKIVSAAVIARDITERRRYEARLQWLAEHDHLTDLLNRRRFEEELRREIRRSARSGQAGAVISVDLDGFKGINDTAGHAAGDAVLREVAQALMHNLRSVDIISRLGGDEFAVLLPSTEADQARTAAQHLLTALHDCSVLVEGTPFRINASLGVALFGGEETPAEELMVNADLAMYAAKQQGRDRIVVFTPEEAQSARAGAKVSWSQQIRTALESGGLLLHWQVIVDLATGRPSHGELLLRMLSGGKIVAPQEFLGAAERHGLIHAIDRWVVGSAIRLLAEGLAPGGMPLSVNLSGQSVAGDPDLLGLIERELTSSGVDPGQLIFEITETAAIANIVEARNFALGVHELGCRIALDDFGTGFGSFYHLKHLPVDFLKIDQEFVENLPHNPVDQRLVASIVEVARSLGILTVAESVGDERTIGVLRELGVDYIQGFHVGKPKPVP